MQHRLPLLRFSAGRLKATYESIVLLVARIVLITLTMSWVYFCIKGLAWLLKMLADQML